MNLSVSNIPSKPVLKPNADWCRFGIRDPVFLTDMRGWPILENGKLVVFFNGRDKPIPAGGVTRVGRAVAEDLDNWDIGDDFIFEDGAYAALGSAIKVEERDYRLFYSYDTASGFRLATSQDGLSWAAGTETLLTPEQFGCSRIGLPFVYKAQSEWRMVFEGITKGGFRIFAACSENGVCWQPANGGAPLYAPELGAWDDGGQANPSMLPRRDAEDDGCIILYNGQKAKDLTGWDIGVTTIYGAWSKATAAPGRRILERRQIPWKTTRLEGARWFFDNKTKRNNLLYFALPSEDSYKDGVIGMVGLDVIDDRAAQRSLEAEARANDALSERYFKIWDEAPIQKFTRLIENRWIAQLLKNGQSVLLAGAGGGREIEALLGVAGKIVAVDISPSMLEQGKSRFPESHIEWRCADIQNLPPDLVGFDHAMALGGVFAYLPDPQKAVQSINNALAPGGMLTIAVMNKNHPTETEGYAELSDGRIRRPYTVEELNKLLADGGFEVTATRGYRYFADLLPKEWNLQSDVNIPDRAILDDLLRIEESLIDKLPPEQAKFLWITGAKVSNAVQV